MLLKEHNKPWLGPLKFLPLNKIGNFRKREIFSDPSLEQLLENPDGFGLINIFEFPVSPHFNCRSSSSIFSLVLG